MLREVTSSGESFPSETSVPEMMPMPSSFIDLPSLISSEIFNLSKVYNFEQVEDSIKY